MTNHMTNPGTGVRVAAPHKIPNAAEIWKQFEDLLIPRLRLSMIERVLYSHLLRHSWLEGKPRVRFSFPSLTRSSGLSRTLIRKGLRRLLAKGALHLAGKGKWGHTIEVRLPQQLRAVRAAKFSAPKIELPPRAVTADLENLDFLQTRALRNAIHSREASRCFYCLRRTRPAARCLDHVIPRAWMGTNSYRNLVSCCIECNSKKAERRAEDFLRWLFRERRLDAPELKDRLRALDRLASGKLRPLLS